MVTGMLGCSVQDTLLAIEKMFTYNEMKLVVKSLGGGNWGRFKSKANCFEHLALIAKQQRTLFGKPLPINKIANQSLEKGPKSTFSSRAIRVMPHILHFLSRSFALYYLTAHRFAPSVANSSVCAGLLVKFKKLKFAEYHCNPEYEIFPSRKHLILYEYAMEIHIRAEALARMAFAKEKSIPEEITGT
mmetsp:Transcript_14658/g.18120  ORF Transcript_14658/g.18120 Transcript_14658/m.18120 type:complete len:188 (-) Transcript_14658:346-909(-)